MKKIIASFCAMSALGFAVALANADDNAMSAPQAPSAQAAPAATTESTTAQTDENGNRVSSTSKWKNMKSCTDAEGITYYRGKKGYESCATAMKKSVKKSEQMGGTADNSNMNTSPSSDSSNTSSTDVK